MKNTGKITVTIGLCVKNAETTIEEAVNSIVNQDFPPELVEVIVVDGYSQDKTLSIIRECLSRADIRKRFCAENEGLGFARQMVVDNANGKYILWVDGDIILSKDYVRQQVNFMEQHTSVGIAVGSFGVLKEDNWVAALENISYVVDSSRHQGKETSKLIGTEASIFRVEAIRQVGGFDPHIKGSQEDIDAAYRIKKAGWELSITNAVFHERQKRTWRALWQQHSWYGYGLHFMQHKNKGRNLILDRSVDRIPFSFHAYRLTHQKVVFLLPLNFIFKKAALLFGFLKAHMDGYGHNYRATV